MTNEEKRIKSGNLTSSNTGYPHLDKPWMHFYKDHDLSAKIPKTNLVEFLKEGTKQWENNIASDYYGAKTTYKELFAKADKAATILSQVGIKKGDVAVNLVPNIPQAGEIWLGGIQIGCVSDFIDPRPDSMDLEANAKKLLEVISFEQAKHIIALDKCYLGMLKPIEKQLKDMGIEKIITLSPADSMNFKGTISYLIDVVNYNKLKNIRNANTTAKKLKWYQALLQSLKMMRQSDEAYNVAVKNSPLEIIKYSDLLKDCQTINFERVTDPNATIYIGHTSGTSGARPKPIPITNLNAMSTLDQLKKSKSFYEPDDRCLHILPYYAPFGTFDNWLVFLYSGACNIDIPEFEINEFGYLLKKYHPNVIMTVPAWLTALPDCEYLKNEDMSCLRKIIYGGDSMTKHDEERVNAWLKEHGSKAVVTKGYGMSEFCGCGSYSRANYNPTESIGIPLVDTTFGLVDPSIDDKLVPIKFEPNKDRVEGELIVSSEAVTSGILHNDVIVPHYELDGQDYIRTRDIVEMDRDGIFYHKARKDRSFVRFDGYKVKPYEIEDAIALNPEVNHVAIVPYFEEKCRGIMPMCQLVLNNPNVSQEEEEQIVHDIVYKYIIGNPNMASRQIPSKFKFRNYMPLTKNGKIDFRALSNEELDGNEINVIVTETNLTVSNIEIGRNQDLARSLKK